MYWLTLCLVLLSFFVQAQIPEIRQPILNAMKDVAVMVGEWEGRGYRLDPAGEQHWSNIIEEIQFKLDGTVLQIQGQGKSDEGQVVHEAMAILYFDAFQRVYKMDSHLASGLYANASFKVIKASKEFQWSFDTPMGQFRYTIKITDDSSKWHEIGEFARDQTNWIKVFEINLVKS